MLQPVVHYGIHILLPLLVALLCFKSKWKLAFLMMLSAFLIDLDHLLATPVFESNRCSIGFHPLHSYYMIPIYVILAALKKTRIIGLGLLIHILADWVDCMMMSTP